MVDGFIVIFSSILKIHIIVFTSIDNKGFTVVLMFILLSSKVR